VGEERSFAQLRQILSRVCEDLEGEATMRGCVASSSFPVAGEARPPDTLIGAIAGSGCTGRVALVNDVVPLLWAPELAAGGVVVNSGTGSVVMGLAGDGSLVKLGGHEHIISDQGSAYALARKGLRAAMRAADGLGPSTELMSRAEAFYRLPMRELGRRLAELPRPRHEVARFAPEVLAVDLAGDEVASHIVSKEAMALARAAVEVAQRLSLGEEPPVGFSGGVMRGSAHYRSLVKDAMSAGSFRPDVQLLDSLAATLDFAELDSDEAARHIDTVGGIDIAVG